MLSDIDRSYLAGVMDSDGCFSIRRSTYGMRVTGECKNPVYYARATLKQVDDVIPKFLHEHFGGSLMKQKSQNKNGKPFLAFEVTCKKAAALCKELLPFLRIKKRRAEILIELSDSKRSLYKRSAHWFLKNNPEWEKMNLITITEASALIGMSKSSVRQAVSNKTIPAIPYDWSGKERARVPSSFCEILVAQRSGGGHGVPEDLLEWRVRLWEELRELNKSGINGTSVYRREGCHATKVA